MNGKNGNNTLDDETRDSLLLDLKEDLGAVKEDIGALKEDVGALKEDMGEVLKAVRIDLPKRINNAFDDALARAAQGQLASIRRFREMDATDKLTAAAGDPVAG